MNMQYITRKFKNPELDAYLDELTKNDPMHSWLFKETAELKEGIRSGSLREIYKDMFNKK